VDEAGRGPWAGPVVAAAVVLGRTRRGLPVIDDSKRMARAAREEAFSVLCGRVPYGVGVASVEEIDALNILQASMLAMQRAVARLPQAPDVVLVDGNYPPKLGCRVQCIVEGDTISLSIAAASIIAKVTRDRMMAELAREHPHYGFERHVGYGTRQHQAALALHGVTAHHRRSFAPIRALLATSPSRCKGEGWGGGPFLAANETMERAPHLVSPLQGEELV
jgi:ribonuclease HII